MPHPPPKAKGAFPRVAQKEGLQPQLLHGQDIFLVEDTLNLEEARAFVRAAEERGFQDHSSRGPAHGEALRDNGRLAVSDEALAAHLWQATGLQAVFSRLRLQGQLRAVGLNPNLRFYRYTRGQHFGRHVDDAVSLGPGLETHYTLLVYLSGSRTAPAQEQQQQQQQGGRALRPRKGQQPQPQTGAEALSGGETVFYGPRGRTVASVAPVAGRALLHRHGDECLEHEGRAVAAGVKYVLRSDVVFGVD